MVWARTRVGQATDGTAGDFVFADALADFQSKLGSDILGCTVIRARGEVLTQTSATTATRSGLVLGARVVDQSSLATMTDASGPDSDRYGDWFMWQPFSMLGAPEQARTDRQIIDVRAMRKLEELGQTILLGFQSPDAFTVIVTGYISWLLKLP